MPLRLRADRRIELRWWWEGQPPGNPVLFRDPGAARLYVASLCARPELSAALRRFVHEGVPGMWSAPGDPELIERLATAVATGRVKIAALPMEALPSWGEPRVEEAPAAVVARAEPTAPVEEVCWPCLRAAASARALRAASSDGAPFVVQG